MKIRSQPALSSASAWRAGSWSAAETAAIPATLERIQDGAASGAANLRGSTLVVLDGEKRPASPSLTNDYNFGRHVFEPVMAFSGVRVARSVSEHQVSGFDCCQRTQLLGGWTEHGFFFHQAIDQTRDGQPVDGGEATRAFAFGHGESRYQLPETGAASWTGIAVAGRTEGSTRYLGAARLTADFLQGVIDVAFTDMRAPDDGTAIADMAFSDVPLGGNGFAAGAREGDDWIAGSFAGDSSLPEVGGVFEKPGLQGAFGATRD